MGVPDMDALQAIMESDHSGTGSCSAKRPGRRGRHAFLEMERPRGTRPPGPSMPTAALVPSHSGTGEHYFGFDLPVRPRSTSHKADGRVACGSTGCVSLRGEEGPDEGPELLRPLHHLGVLCAG
jgi:hypothetical protein